MAYTYDDFTMAATNAGLLNTFSPEDLSAAQTNPEYGISLVKLYQDVNGATTPEQKLLAQEAVNQLRKSFTGSQTTGSFTYGQENAYQQMLDRVVNRDPFSYDPSTDPVMSAYKKSHLREGERAIETTLAKNAAMSGGRPSTYAITAAQQAGNYYAGQLNDVIPTLEENAYQRYLNGFSADISALEAMNTDRNFDYNVYLQDYAQKQQEWDNALKMYQMGLRTPQVLAVLGLTGVNLNGGSGGSGGSGGGKKPGDPESEELTVEEQAIAALQGQYKNGVITDDNVYVNAIKMLGGSQVLDANGLKYSPSSAQSPIFGAGGAGGLKKNDWETRLTY